MKRFRKAVCLVVVVLIVGLVGCGQDKQTIKGSDGGKANNKSDSAAKEQVKKDITLKFGYWGSSGEDKAYAKAIEGVDKAVLGVKVELQQYPSAKDFWDNLPAQIAAKTAPDMINVTNEGYMEYIKNGLFVPLDEYVKSANLDLSGLTKSTVDIWTVDGKLYGIPTTAAPAAFIVNMDMWKAAGLKELPKTMDDVKEAAKVLTKNGVKGICADIMQYHLTQYVIAFGGGWGNGKTINSPENVKGLQFVLDMYKDGVAISAKQAGLGWDGEVFSKGKCAMSTGGTWYTGFLKDAAPDMNYEIIAMPKGTVDGCTMHSYAYTVLKDAIDKEATVKVAYYMARDEYQQANAKLTGGMPSSTKIVATYFDKNPKLKNLQPAIKFSKPFGYPADKRFQDELVKACEEAVYVKDSQKTAQSILDDLQKMINN